MSKNEILIREATSAKPCVYGNKERYTRSEQYGCKEEGSAKNAREKKDIIGQMFSQLNLLVMVP